MSCPIPHSPSPPPSVGQWASRVSWISGSVGQDSHFFFPFILSIPFITFLPLSPCHPPLPGRPVGQSAGRPVDLPIKVQRWLWASAGDRLSVRQGQGASPFLVVGGLPRARSGAYQILVVVTSTAQDAMILFECARAWQYWVDWSERPQWYSVRWWTQ